MVDFVLKDLTYDGWYLVRANTPEEALKVAIKGMGFELVTREQFDKEQGFKLSDDYFPFTYE
jgi:hypothetical protein